MSENPSGSKEETTASALTVPVSLFAFTKALLVLSIAHATVGLMAFRSVSAEVPWPEALSAAPTPNRLPATGFALVTSWALDRRTALGWKVNPETDCPPLKLAMWHAQGYAGERVPVTA